MAIVTLPDPVLRRPAEMIPDYNPADPQFQRLLRDMIHELREANGLGLAAPQVGMGVCVIVLDPARTGSPRVLVNPVLVEIAPVWNTAEEGCLSCPGEHVKIHRPRWCKVNWFDSLGKPHLATFHTLAARVVQHELEHLAGRLIVDHKKGAR